MMVFTVHIAMKAEPTSILTDLHCFLSQLKLDVL